MNITLICADDDIWALGTRSISAALKVAGHKTKMIFAGSMKVSLDQKIFDQLALLTGESEIIGISSMSRASERAKLIIAGLKPLNKLIVWGGMHPTIFPEDCVPHADMICRGEGENFMVELAERIAAGRSFADIENAGFLNNGNIQLNPLRPLISSLDSLEFPDFSFGDEFILDEEGKFAQNNKMRDTSRILFSGSRGCNYHCHYCSNSQLKTIYKSNKRYVRKMTIPRFVAAVEKCRNIFPKAQRIFFTDEDFFARPIEEIKEFAEIYPSRAGLKFECMVSPLQITEDKMDYMVKAGMWRIDLGVESGSDRTKRQIFNRCVDNKFVLNAATIINNYTNVVVYYFFIIANPYEKNEDLLQTIELLKSLPPPYFIRIYNLIFIPGTHLFNRACQDGIINGINDSGFELNFTAGLDPREHKWKEWNLYLNSLIALMSGKSTKYRIGLLPKKVIPMLTSSGVVRFCDRNLIIGKTLASMGRTSLTVRRAGLEMMMKTFKDNRIAYDLRFLLKRNE